MDIARIFLISLALHAWRKFDLDLLSCKALFLLCFILFILLLKYNPII